MKKVELTRYGKVLKEYIQEDYPKLFQSEQELDEFCLAREERAIKQRNNLVNQGMNYSEAEEMIWPELMSISSQE